MSKRPTGWLLLPLLCACGGPDDEVGRSPTPRVEREVQALCAGATLGIDFNTGSQGNLCAGVDFSTFKANGGTFAMMKATEGDGTTWQYVDPNFPADWPAAKAAGVIRGAYAYLHLELPGDAQAQYLYDTVRQAGGSQSGDLPPMLDLEQACDWDWVDCPGAGQGCCPNCCPGSGGCSTSASRCTSAVVPAARIQAVAQAFLDKAEALTGRTPLIYTYGWYWANRVGAPASFSKYPLWFADCSNCTCPPSPGTTPPWGRATFDQFNWNAQSLGIPNGCADADEFNGSLAQLQQFANAGLDGGPVDPCATTLPGYNGLYCGSSTESGFAGGDPNDLYDCQNQATAQKTPCPYGCTVEPSGTNDRCNPPPPHLDAGQPPKDAGQADAGQPPPLEDAGTPPEGDAGQAPKDAGPAEDAGTIPDGGEPSDSGAAPDGGPAHAAVQGGCHGCGSGAGDLSGAGLLLALAAAIRRRTVA